MSKFSEWLSELITIITNWWKSKEAPDSQPTDETPPKVPSDTTPTNPKPTPIRILEKGMIGEDVKKIQQKFKDIGYKIDVDGEYGNETEKVVIDFQRYNGIGQTGRVGPQTLAAILAAKPENRPNAKGALAAADLAEREGQKHLMWTGMSSEAEKYLAELRNALGQHTGKFAWCGAFVTWCFRKSGVNIPLAFSTGYTAAYVPGWEIWAKAKGFWYPWDVSFVPQRGDIVVFGFGDSVGTHIGVVLRYINGATIVTAEGNTSIDDAGSQTSGNSTDVKTRYRSGVRGFIRFPSGSL